MKWQYKASFFLLLLSQTVFLALAAYHTDSELYYPAGLPEAKPSVGYSWIWYHLEQWIISLVFALVALVLFMYGLVTEFMAFRGKRYKVTETGASRKGKWLIVFVLVCIWVIVIFLSLYFSGIFSPS